MVLYNLICSDVDFPKNCISSFSKERMVTTMEKDYSEFEYTDYEKYVARRTQIKGVHLEVFKNAARFYPEERKFQISVEDLFEFCSIQDDIDKHYDAMEVRTGRTIKRHDSPEDEAIYDEYRTEQEIANKALIEKMQQKYRINREGIDYLQDEYRKKCTDTSPEPLINVFSGALIDLNYGEGILDFIYADFITPIKEKLSFLHEMIGFTEALKETYPELVSTEPTKDEPIKVYDQTHVLIQKFFDYNSTFNTVRDIAYASLYSSICPPMFADKFDVREELKRYGSYLLELQKEYLELLEFCFDDSFYNGALGQMYPSERFALYRRYKGLPTFCHRKEYVGFLTRQMMDTKMPFGITKEEFDKRASSSMFATDDQKALAKKLGLPENFIAALNRFPHFMEVQYEFSCIAEILELEFTKMLEHDVRFRKCKRCGRYFIMKGNYDTNYCDSIAPGETRTCQELAAGENYRAKHADDKGLAIYNKYYKRYAARVKVRQIKEDAFKQWKYQAMTKRDECNAGVITPEEYIQWMEDYFPNRKPKQDK